MTKGFPNPITKDTFPAAYDWADRKRCRAKKKRAFLKAAPVITQPVFALVLTALSYGVLYDHGTAMTAGFLEELPLVVDLWKQLRPLVYRGAQTLPEQLLAWCVPLYLLPMALTVIVALGVQLLYHPGSRKLDLQDSPKEQARQLCVALREAKTMKKISGSNVAGLCNGLFAVVWGLAAIGYLLYCVGGHQEEALNSSHLPMVALLGVVVCYQLICLPLTLLQRLLAWHHVPQTVTEAAERWFRKMESDAGAPAPGAVQPQGSDAAQGQTETKL